MKIFFTFLLLTLFGIGTTVVAEDFPLQLGRKNALHATDYAKFSAYRDRLRYRRMDALAIRRQMYLSRPPARGWLAIRVPFNAALPMGTGIEAGWVRQPAIPRPTRRRVYVSPTIAHYR